MSKSSGTSRYPGLTPTKDNLDAEQSVQHEYLANITKKVYNGTIVTQNPDESMAGPFNILLYTPTMAQPWCNLQLATAGLLPPVEAESAVLGVLSITRAVYGIYAHTILAQKAGFTLSQVEAMLAGDCPSDITERQSAIFKLAVKLAQMRGPLDSVSFNEALFVLGRDGVTAAIQQSAAFMHAAILLNAADVGLPNSVE